MVSPDSAPAEAHRRTAAVDALEGRYQSLFAIGRGGMGSVEVALDRGPGGSGRVVALKRLLPESARDPRRKEMFVREATIAALLTHPNVVHAYAYGELYDELFLAMEYVEGESLSRVLAAVREHGEALDPGVAALILALVCDGLHAAHELRDAAGEPLHLVHRDVSPHNVMIAYDGHVKILDFGVAKFEAASQHTRTGEVKGKMAYMSPEQALGDNLDRRSDLYSVGAVLFECVAGRRMWEGETDMEVMRRLALQAPPKLDDVVPGAAAPLALLHARLTARELDARPATAQEVATELRAFAATRSPTADLAAVRELMDRFFRAEARARRAQLAEALENAPSSCVAVVRSVEANGMRGHAAAERSAIATGLMGRSRATMGSRSRAWWAVAAALFVTATVVTWRVTSGRDEGSPTNVRTGPTAQAPPPPMIPPFDPKDPNPVPTAMTTAITTAVPVAIAPRSGASVGSSSTSSGAAPSSAPRTRAAVSKPPRPAPPHLPDVDPTPF